MPHFQRLHASEITYDACRIKLNPTINPTCRISVWAFIKRHLGVLPASLGYGGIYGGRWSAPLALVPAGLVLYVWHMPQYVGVANVGLSVGLAFGCPQ